MLELESTAFKSQNDAESHDVQDFVDIFQNVANKKKKECVCV